MGGSSLSAFMHPAVFGACFSQAMSHYIESLLSIFAYLPYLQIKCMDSTNTRVVIECFYVVII